MIASNILKQALLFMGDNQGIDEQNLQTEPTKSKVDFLLKCLSITYSEIANEYIPLYKQSDIVVENNEYSLSNLTNCYKVYRLTQEGKMVQFRLLDGKIIVPSGKYKITYSQNVGDVEYTSTLSDFDGKVGIRNYIYGLIKEFYLAKGMYEEYKIYEQKFHNAMIASTLVVKEKIIKKRRWR